ncbi:MAG: TIGR04190 family B12-binding domain/radical SAM domain protein [Chloroflexi bacterium]|nr:TIGR04190 family B12-binding domain/radical SAM domain protein [Chloroflexota bacterium]
MHDLILIHPPSVFDFRDRAQLRGPIADVIPSTDQFEMYPIGMTSIAAYLARNNYRVRIVNLARRMVADPGFDAVRHLGRLRSRVFGIDLHWLAHAQGALAVARLIRRLHPAARVLMGGLSASYYHEDLIRDPSVDLVLRGDSTEEPCRQLLQALREGRRLDTVANLTHKRADGTVVVNALSYVPADIDSFELPAYEHILRSVFGRDRLADALPYHGWLARPLTVLLSSRGCTLECTTCGGSRSAYRMICGRSQPAFRSPERMVADLRAIRSFSRAPVFVVHDPRIGGARRARRLFELLARERVQNELVFELFAPAGRGLFGALARSVERWSLQITIESQEERLRRINGKFACSNERIEETIALAFEHGCHSVDVFYMVGVPGQTYESALGIADHCERLLERFSPTRTLRPFVAPLAPFLDPGSRVFEDPSMGYRKQLGSLAEHEDALLEADWTRTLSFETDAMTRAQMVEATYAVTERMNDLNLRFGLITPTAHEAAARCLRAAREAVPMGPEQRDAAWMFAKEEMSWSGTEGIRPTPRLAWTLLTGLVSEVAQAASRRRGVYDTHVVR